MGETGTWVQERKQGCNMGDERKDKKKKSELLKVEGKV